jgi:thiol-disulfide isomerase/thioredoxin
MNINSLRRRQLLWYLGLSTGTAALSIGFKQADSQTSASDKIPSSLAVAAPNTKSLPEFQGISQWLNSPDLDVAQLRGKVVLVQFWTFACINCQRTLPYITRWHREYAKQGLQVVGIHTPEFPFERDANNVKRAVKQYQINYPVGLDNEYKTWEAYQNQHWPHLFLADRQGFLHYDHIGEGAYDKTEQTIRTLLG